MDAKYYKDLSHNYLILRSTGNLSTIDSPFTKEDMGYKNEYQNKMITGNKMKYLLPCSIRNINDEIYFYYEISSKQSIKNLYERGGMKYEQMFQLFEYLLEASREVGKYLLEDNRLLFSPEYIYADPEGEEFFFVYYPGDGDTPIMPLAEFLLEKADRENERTVQIIYKIYEHMQDENFILPEIMKLFHEPAGHSAADGKDEDGRGTDDAEEAKGIRTERIANEQKELVCRAWPGAEIEEEDTKDENEEERTLEKGNMIISGVLLLLCIGTMVSVFCIRYFCILSIEESVLTVAGIITLVIVSSFLLLSLIMAPVRGRRYGKRGDEKRKIIEEEDEEPQQYMAVNAYFQPKKEREDSLQRGREKEDVYGSTVFIETSLYSIENKLYGTNKGNKYHIDLNKLPCTIGKMVGGVDFVIKDSSMSRIHARFTKDGENIYVTDLNSTNGTFKNGLRLEPNETAGIEAGDELRFGKMAFCYR
ncbi:FHA domain-containing protein [Kineothrix alysoides]|uniref:FHA domain-containing protein n=1 Tax=Kineothrix alysoides TaxID=1469948 RepID=A0A4R1QKZ8_9FIRM|nr:DUF6382 domain-containing protein [Kineothrix alysoides]TCL54286.1 FHA domain-containing protein [Kineothrix alysoides]